MDIKTILEIIGESYVETIIESMKFYDLEDSNIIKNVTYSISNNTVIINIPSYAIFIEQGRRPLSKMPPLNVILAWVKRKRIKGRDKKSGRFIKDNVLVFLIARAIARRGIRPRPFLKKANQIIGNEVAETFALDFSDLIDNEIKRIIKG